jgi:uncharacterized membrane protein
MDTSRLVLTYLFTLLMLAAGITHFIKTRLYLKIVPEFFPFRIFIVQISGIVEIVFGVGLLIAETQKSAAAGVLMLMILLLPLHIWDIFREKPAFGSKVAAGSGFRYSLL